MLDSGKLIIYGIENVAGNGEMPRSALVEKSRHWYESRTVGVTRFYAAQKANSSVDMLVRVWRDGNVEPGDICVLQDGQQYRVGQIQQTYDADALAVTDLALERLEENYDIEADG